MAKSEDVGHEPVLDSLSVTCPEVTVAVPTLALNLYCPCDEEHRTHQQAVERQHMVEATGQGKGQVAQKVSQVIWVPHEAPEAGNDKAIARVVQQVVETWASGGRVGPVASQVVLPLVGNVHRNQAGREKDDHASIADDGQGRGSLLKEELGWQGAHEGHQDQVASDGHVAEAVFIDKRRAQVVLLVYENHDDVEQLTGTADGKPVIQASFGLEFMPSHCT